MSESLKDKTINGVGWSFADNILSQGIPFLVGLVLARLLSPEEFGLIGIITIFIAVFNSIVDSGFSSALIRRNDIKQIDYNTVFIFNLLLSIILFIVLYVSAPAIGKFFNQPLLISLSRAMSCIVIINAFAIIQRTILVKNVDFRTQTKISVIASVTSGIIGIVMAIFGLGVWSLVGQQIARQLLNSIFLWVFNTWRPSLQFSFKSFKDLFSFGWKLLISGLLDTIWKQVYQVVIGKCYNTETLGQYTRADQFNTIFSSNLTAVIQRVSYPILSSIQDDKNRLRESYRKIIKTTMFVTFICMLGLASISKSMILVLIGEKWLPCVTYLQIICFSGMLYPLHALNLNMLQVKGRSDIFLYLEIIKKILAVGPVLLGIFVNIYWMLWSSVILGFICYFLNSYYPGRDIGYNSFKQLKDIFPSFVVAAIMAAIVYALSFIEISPFLMLPLQLTVGFIVIVIICESTRLTEYIEVKKIVLSTFNKVRHGK